MGQQRILKQLNMSMIQQRKRLNTQRYSTESWGWLPGPPPRRRLSLTLPSRNRSLLLSEPQHSTKHKLPSQLIVTLGVPSATQATASARRALPCPVVAASQLHRTTESARDSPLLIMNQ